MAGLPESMADLQQLFQLGQQMQGRLQQLQSELAERTIETTAGGGVVTEGGGPGFFADFNRAPHANGHSGDVTARRRWPSPWLSTSRHDHDR